MMHLRWASVALAATLAVGGCTAETEPDTNAEPTLVATVSVAPIVADPWVGRASAFGVTSDAGRDLRVVSAPFAAQIVEVVVEPEQRVAAGDPIAIIGATPTAVSELDGPRVAVESAQANLREIERQEAAGMAIEADRIAAEGALHEAEAALRAARRRVGSREETLSASSDAVVSAVEIIAGQWVDEGTPLVRLVPASAEQVTLQVLPHDLSTFAVGTTFGLRAPGGEMDPTSAVVTEVGAVVDAETHRVPVVATLPAGMVVVAGVAVLAEADLPAVDGWRVPRDAVSRRGANDVVFVVDDGVAREVQVTLLGERGDARWVQAEALTAGAQVVTTGAHAISDQTHVTTETP